MLKDKDYWVPVFNEFADEYPELFERCIDWYPSAQLEITVKLDDGYKYAYDFITKEVRTLRDEPYDILEDEYKILFGINLRKKLNRAFMTQEELEYRIGVSQGMVSRYLSGKSIPGAYMLLKISRALECSVAELVELSI